MISRTSPIWAAAVALSVGIPATMASGQGLLTIMEGEAASSVKVNTNRAVVLEVAVPFAELSVANPAIADVATLSDRTIYILGREPGRTSLTLLGPDGRLITNVDVQVEPDLAEFKERLKAILPGEPIEVRTANGGIVLSGSVSSITKLSRALELAERYAAGAVSNLMTVSGSNQVMLKVRFAEMNRSVSKALGSSIGFTAGSGNFSSAGETGTFLDGDNAPFAPVAVNGSEGAFRLGFTSGSLAIEVLIEALETKGLVRTLAEPTLVALSGQQASFLAGGEIPFQVDGGDGGDSIQFQQYGVQLDFLPTVLDGGNINISINASVTDLDFATAAAGGVTGNPALTSRTTSTVVELKDGQSLAIAGLLQDDFTDSASQVPWLGNIPVLGALFRSAEFSRQQTELVIIITPNLVSPVDGDTLALPTDRIQPPSEAELFLLGQTTGKPGTVAGQDFSGSYGYVLE